MITAPAIHAPDRHDGPGVTTHLAQLVQARRLLDDEMDAEVDRLATSGVSWPVIAIALGVTRQAARQRHVRRRQGSFASHRLGPTLVPWS